MAEKKLSARQKMINMMYLVLTALLALNVSAEILHAFEDLRFSMARSVQEQNIKNNELAEGVKKYVEQQINKGDVRKAYLLPLVDSIRQKTHKTIHFIDSLTSQLREIGDYDNSTGMIRRMDETNENYSFWLGTNDEANSGRGNGEAIKLKSKLENYINWANQLYAANDSNASINHFPSLTKDPANDKRIRENSPNKRTWEHYTFNGKPLIADLATLQKFRMDIKNVEGEMLQQLKKMLAEYMFTIDTLMAMEAPSAAVLVAGMPYETRLFVGLGSGDVKPEFVGNGITVDPEGNSAVMRMMASANVIPQGASEGIQRYRALIKVPKSGGGFQELPLEGSFKVRKPEVQVRSKAVQILYRNCGNEVEVSVPALGDLYNPDFSGSQGGQVVQSSSNKKEVTLIPTGSRFNLSVQTVTNSQRVKLDDIEYKVIAPPKPRMVVTMGNREVNNGQTVNRRQRLIVKLAPDNEFANTLRRDARYRVANVKLMLKRSFVGEPTVIASARGDVMRGIPINLYQGAIRNAAPGATIYIEIEGPKRVNFQNREVSVGMARAELIKAFQIR